MPKYKGVQAKLDTVSGLTKENLVGARVVRAFGAEEREKARFNAASETLAGASIRVGALSALLNPLTYATLNLAVIAVLYFGGIKVDTGALTQGEIIALVNYMTQILNAMVVFANLLVIFTKASASAARINEVFDTKPSIEEGKGATPDYDAPAVELINVTFSYTESGNPALENANLTLNKGESLGILGGTGSGKTTLINLITGLYKVKTGEVRVFGNDIKDYTFEELYSFFGVAPQKCVLFSGTVRDNMKWGNESATDEEINLAIERAQAKEFVEAKKEGLDFVIAQEGKNLSGGQRQRLTIARALVKNPKILILDDSSSALDFATDAKLRKSLGKMREEEKLTTITVSQRVTGLKYCDEIIVLEDGKTVGKGKHDELMSSCETYREIFMSQNKGEETK